MYTFVILFLHTHIIEHIQVGYIYRECIMDTNNVIVMSNVLPRTWGISRENETSKQGMYVDYTTYINISQIDIFHSGFHP